MSRIPIVWPLFLVLAVTLALLTGCSVSSQPTPVPAPLSTSNLNLIFVVSEDLAYQAPGDVNPQTANLTNRGLQRSLLMGTFLQQKVLGGSNVTSIYALEPMTHLQTANNYPDMVSLVTIQRFAVLNQASITIRAIPLPRTVFRSSHRIASGSVPMELDRRCILPLARASTSATRTATTKLWSAVSSRQRFRDSMCSRRRGRRLAPSWQTLTGSRITTWRCPLAMPARTMFMRSRSRPREAPAWFLQRQFGSAVQLP